MTAKKTKTEEPFTENPDGSVTVHLRSERTLDGEARKDIVLREPTAGDFVDADNGQRSQAQQEIFILSNLAELTPDAIRGLPMKDYARLQLALGFMSG